MTTHRRPLCRDHTKTGDPCRNRAAAGSAYCGSHGGGRRVGAPKKLTPHTTETILAAITAGATYEVAAQAAGISRETLRQWRETGEHDLERDRNTPQSDLVAALRDARAQAEVDLLQRIRAHGATDWRPLAWILERRHPERWAQRTKVDVDVNERAQPREVAPADDERRATIIAILAAATAPPPTPTP